jgi:hypothetical protein
MLILRPLATVQSKVEVQAVEHHTWKNGRSQRRQCAAPTVEARTQDYTRGIDKRAVHKLYLLPIADYVIFGGGGCWYSAGIPFSLLWQDHSLNVKDLSTTNH